LRGLTRVSADFFLEDTVSDVIKSCPAGAAFLIGVSGGADSMAMLAALRAVSPRERLVCMHIEHGLRPAEESCADADFVRDFCTANNIEYRVKHIPPGKIATFAQRKGIGIEAAARFYRHRALRKEAGQLGKDALILLAHTKDDLLETVLMRILRGSGPAGLSAMTVKRGRILRPLLGITREDVISYLKAKNLTWREDSTNADEKFLRNRIRRKLIPLLNDSFPSWKTNLFALAQTQSLTAEFIGKEAGSHINWEEEGTTRRKSSKTLFTDEANFFAQPQIIREEALFQAIDIALLGAKNMRSVKRAVVRRFCEGSLNAADLGSVKVRREKGNITISAAPVKDFFECGISRLLK